MWCFLSPLSAFSFLRAHNMRILPDSHVLLAVKTTQLDSTDTANQRENHIRRESELFRSLRAIISPARLPLSLIERLIQRMKRNGAMLAVDPSLDDGRGAHWAQPRGGHVEGYPHGVHAQH